MASSYIFGTQTTEAVVLITAQSFGRLRHAPIAQKNRKISLLLLKQAHGLEMLILVNLFRFHWGYK